MNKQRIYEILKHSQTDDDIELISNIACVNFPLNKENICFYMCLYLTLNALKRDRGENSHYWALGLLNLDKLESRNDCFTYNPIITPELKYFYWFKYHQYFNSINEFEEYIYKEHYIKCKQWIKVLAI